MNEEQLEKQMKKVIKLNKAFQTEDAKFTENVKKFFNLTDEQEERLFTTFDDIVDALQYATGNISWNMFKKHVEEINIKIIVKGGHKVNG